MGRNNGDLKRNAKGGKSFTEGGEILNQNTSQIENMTDQFFSSLSLWNTLAKRDLTTEKQPHMGKNLIKQNTWKNKLI